MHDFARLGTRMEYVVGVLMLCATLKPLAACYNLPMHHFRVHIGVRRIACIDFFSIPHSLTANVSGCCSYRKRVI